jgi:hypothetical protein
MFNQGPANALFRTEAFNRLGGFADLGPHSDLAFWLRACRSVSVLLIPADLYWYRVHEGQHLRTCSRPSIRRGQRAFYWEALVTPECPLSGANSPWPAECRLCGGQTGASGLKGGACSWRGVPAPQRPERREWVRYLRPPRRAAAPARRNRPPDPSVCLHNSAAPADKSGGFGSLHTCLVGPNHLPAVRRVAGRPQ